MKSRNGAWRGRLQNMEFCEPQSIMPGILERVRALSCLVEWSSFYALAGTVDRNGRGLICQDGGRSTLDLSLVSDNVTICLIGMGELDHRFATRTLRIEMKAQVFVGRCRVEIERKKSV
jgi:hypothetical protein